MPSLPRSRICSTRWTSSCSLSISLVWPGRTKSQPGRSGSSVPLPVGYISLGAFQSLRSISSANSTWRARHGPELMGVYLHGLGFSHALLLPELLSRVAGVLDDRQVLLLELHALLVLLALVVKLPNPVANLPLALVLARLSGDL